MTLISYQAESSYGEPPISEDILEHASAIGDLREPLRDAANYLTTELGPHPLGGIRRWLDHDSVPPGMIINTAELAEGGDAATRLLEHGANLWGSTPHVATALAWKTYSYWASLPAVLGYVSARRVPLWSPKDTHFIVSRHNPLFSLHLGDAKFAVLPDDPLATHVDAVVAEDSAQLRQMTRQSLFDQHLSPAISSLSKQARVGRRNLLGSLASGICYAVANAAKASNERAEDIASDLLETFEVAHLVEISSDDDDQLVYQRRTCCLAFKLEGRNICSTCCLPEARNANQ